MCTPQVSWTPSHHRVHDGKYRNRTSLSPLNPKQYLVRNGVRIRFRDDRGVDAAVGESKGRGEGRARTARKNTTKSTTQLSPESADVQIGSVEASAMAMSFGRDNDNSRKDALLAASQMWRNSPGGGDYHRTYDADEPGGEVPPVRYVHRM
jgi:hypothetical protein